MCYVMQHVFYNVAFCLLYLYVYLLSQLFIAKLYHSAIKIIVNITKILHYMYRHV